LLPWSGRHPCCLEVAAISHCCLEVAAIFAFVKWPQLSLNYYNYVLKSINTMNILFFFNYNTGTGSYWSLVPLSGGTKLW
jgi:hypothetical protein